MAVFTADYESDCTECSAAIYPDDKAAYLDDSVVCMACFQADKADSLGFSL